jgi:flotillin
MEEIFTERDQFKRRIYVNIQSELDQFGLKIYNANIKELGDAPGSSYFASLSKKAHESASNQARIDVAEAQMHGNVGEAQRVGKQNQEIAKIHAETAVRKTERDTEKAQAEATLATRKAAFDRDVSIAQIEANRATEARDEELLKQVEIKRAQREVERLRASDVVKATIQREAKQEAAEAKAYEMEAAAKADLFREQKGADAYAYKAKVNAEAANLTAAREADANAYKVKVAAEAAFLASAKEAEASLLRKTKEAEGLSKMADANGKLSHAFGGPQGLIQYMMVEKGLYVDLAKANAQAVQGMQPKITIWNTGASTGAGGDNDATAAIRNTYQMLPPLMSTINEQTGITLPEWQFGKLAAVTGEVSGKMNGAH